MAFSDLILGLKGIFMAGMNGLRPIIRNMELDVKTTINLVIKTDIKALIYKEEGPFIKFLLIVTSIEFLGACLDQHPFVKNEESENRFNKALKKLFPKKYHQYAKSDSIPSLFRDLRCGMIHKFSPLSNKIQLTDRRHFGSKEESQKQHLSKGANGEIYLVLEDFFDDLEDACNKLIKLQEKGKLPNKKLDQPYLSVTTIETGITQSLVTEIKK